VTKNGAIIDSPITFTGTPAITVSDNGKIDGCVLTGIVASLTVSGKGLVQFCSNNTSMASATAGIRILTAAGTSAVRLSDNATLINNYIDLATPSPTVAMVAINSGSPYLEGNRIVMTGTAPNVADPPPVIDVNYTPTISKNYIKSVTVRGLRIKGGTTSYSADIAGNEIIAGNGVALAPFSIGVEIDNGSAALPAYPILRENTIRTGNAPKVYGIKALGRDSTFYPQTRIDILGNTVLPGTATTESYGLYFEDDCDALIVGNAISGGAGRLTTAIHAGATNGFYTVRYNEIYAGNATSESRAIYTAWGANFYLRHNNFTFAGYAQSYLIYVNTMGRVRAFEYNGFHVTGSTLQNANFGPNAGATIALPWSSVAPKLPDHFLYVFLHGASKDSLDDMEEEPPNAARMAGNSEDFHEVEIIKNYGKTNQSSVFYKPMDYARYSLQFAVDRERS
jgi:hypothetical protein